jgi:hypothetical protein
VNADKNPPDDNHMSEQNPVSKGACWGGWIMGVLPALLLIFSAIIKLVQPHSMADQLARSGISSSLMFNLGIVELGCTLIYLVPRTSVLGAILLTGYMGGATLANVQQGGATFVVTVVIGILFWGGLFLRDRRIRALIPLRS